MSANEQAESTGESVLRARLRGWVENRRVQQAIVGLIVI